MIPSGTRLFARNSLVIMAATLITKALSLLFVVAAARYLGTEGYGQYAFIFAVASMLLVLNAFGLDPVVVRDVAAHRTHAGAMLSSAVAVRCSLSAASIGIVMVLSVLVSKPFHVKAGLWIVAVALLVDALIASLKVVMTAHERMELTAGVDIAYRALFVLAGLAVIRWDLGFVPLVSCALLASLVTLGLSFRLYQRYIGPVAWTVNRAHIATLWRQALPFALTGLVVSWYSRVDVVLLSVLRGDREVGWYSAAFGVSETLLLISSAVNTAIFPAFSRMAQQAPDSLRHGFTTALQMLLSIGVPLAVCVSVVSHKVIVLLFGSSFAQAAVALQILVWVAVIVFCNSLMSFLLYALHREQLMVKLTIAMLAFNVAANLVAIPSHGYFGAAATRVVTECLGFGILVVIISKHVVRLDLISLMARPALAALMAGAVVYALGAAPLAAQVAAGVAVYVAVAVLGGYTEAEKQLVRSLVCPR